MEKNNTSLHILAFPSHEVEAKDILQSFGTFFKKDKSDVSVTLFAIDDSLKQSISSNKNLKHILENDQLKISKLESDADLKNALLSNLGQDEDIALCSDFHLQNINAIYSSWLKSGVKSDHLTLLAPSIGKKNKKPLKNRLYSSAIQLFGVQSFTDHFNSVILSRSNQLINLLDGFDQKTKSASSLWRLLSSAVKLKGINCIEEQIEYNAIQKAESSFVKAKLTGISHGLSVRWSWFWKIPLKSLKDPESLSIWDFKHPLYRLLFLCFAFLILVLMPIMSFGFGILWDEPDHIAYAKDVLNYFKSFGADRSVFDETKRIYFAMKVYGISFDTFSILIHQTISPFSDVYDTRHFLNAIVGAIGMIYTGLLARRLGGWRAGFIAMLAIFLSPYFLGHSMNNHKDIPFATGFIMAVYYMLVWLKHLPKPRSKDFVWLIISIGLVCSVRIGGIIVLAFTGLFLGLYWLYQVKDKGFDKAVGYILPFAFYMIIIGLLGFLLGILPWPYGLENPIKHPFEALTVFTNFQLLTIYELFEGQRTYMNEVPWYYIPKFIGITSPLLVLAALPVSVISWFKKQKGVDRIAIWAVLFTIVFPVFYAVYKDSTLYNGWRHFLFIYPALVAVAVLGWEFLFRALKQKIAQISLAVLILVLATKTIIWIVANHPNEYTYYNELVGGYDGAYSYYESDPYGNAMRQGVDWLFENELKDLKDGNIRIGVNMTPITASHYTKKYNEEVAVSWLDDDERYKKDWDYAILAPREFTHAQLTNGAYPPKGTIHVIEVENSPLLAIVKSENDHMPNGYGAAGKGDYRTAITEFEKAVAYDPMNEEARRMLGMAYLNTGNIDKAGEQLLKAVEISPESYMAHSLLGVYYLRRNDANNAINSLKKSIEYKVNFGNSYYQLGQIYYNMGNYAESEKYFDKTLDYLNPTPQMLNFMAGNLLQLSKFDKAIQYLTAALNMDQNFKEAYRGIAIAYQKKGQKDQAEAYMKKYRELGGN